MSATRSVEVARVFGQEFAERLNTVTVGDWHGPMRSDFGVHLVELVERRSGGRATLDEVRAKLERDLLHSRTEDAKAAVYEKLRATYRVRIDDATTAMSPAG
jgi:parvulin-like peptidyl-prolyl isomerase